MLANRRTFTTAWHCSGIFVIWCWIQNCRRTYLLLLDLISYYIHTVLTNSTKMPQPAEVLINNHYHTQLVVNRAQNQTSHIGHIPVGDSFGFHLFAARTITSTVLISYNDNTTNMLNYHATLVILRYSLASHICNISKLRKTTNITFTWYDVNHFIIQIVLSVFIITNIKYHNSPGLVHQSEALAV